MFITSSLSRTVVSALGALTFSTVCVTGAVAPVKADVPHVAAPAVTDASTPAR